MYIYKLKYRRNYLHVEIHDMALDGYIKISSNLPTTLDCDGPSPFTNITTLNTLMTMFIALQHRGR